MKKYLLLFFVILSPSFAHAYIAPLIGLAGMLAGGIGIVISIIISVVMMIWLKIKIDKKKKGDSVSEEATVDLKKDSDENKK